MVRRKAVFNEPCVFPFKLDLNNKTYHACTYDFSHVTGYKPWCSTKVDENGYHVKKNPDGTKNWGVCLEEESSSNCPIPPRSKRKSVKRGSSTIFKTVQSVFFLTCCFYQQIGCGNPINTRQTFVDGEIDKTASITQQPWMVSLGKYAKNSYTQWIHECAGSLITEQHVLTSAHCFSNIFNVDEEGQFTTKKRKQFGR